MTIKICPVGPNKFLVSLYENNEVAYSFYSTTGGLLSLDALIVARLSIPVNV
jgi:hypothetical protein